MAHTCCSHQIFVGSLAVNVTTKPIRNLHLSVVPPNGEVRISAPEAMSPEGVRSYVIAKLGWIRSQQKKFAEQQRERPKLFVERESHSVWGNRLLLHLEEVNSSPRVEIKSKSLVLYVRQGTSVKKRESLLSSWYRSELRRESADLIRQWENRLGVNVNKLFVQKMNCQWGSCNPGTRNIRLNTQLAQKPRVCLDYVILHELAHLIVPNHGESFIELLNAMQPDWRERKSLLNRLPLESI